MQKHVGETTCSKSTLISDLFRFAPPPITEHVQLHSKPLCRNIAYTAGGANNIHPLRWGAQTEKIPNFFHFLHNLIPRNTQTKITYSYNSSLDQIGRHGHHRSNKTM